MKIRENIYNIGSEDKNIQYFENQFKLHNGMSFNSYLILDEKVMILDTIDEVLKKEWFDNLEKALGGRTPDYLMISHMEPDHSAAIDDLVAMYPNIQILGSSKALTYLDQFFNKKYQNTKALKEGDELCLGKYNLTFYAAPMVHWPEVMVTYLKEEKILFSADGFGAFGIKSDDNWDSEARRYYYNIVGKYGKQTSKLLDKIDKLDVQAIASLHGKFLDKDLDHYISLYRRWSSYQYDKEGVALVYASIYGNTKKAALELEKELLSQGKDVRLVDLNNDDISFAVDAAFENKYLVCASPTYDAVLYPPMYEFLYHLRIKAYQNRTVGFIENGSWAPASARLMKKEFELMKNIEFLDTHVSIKSALNDDSRKELIELSKKIG